ncbi:hypothetical protein HNR74_000371 [Flammeovirga kamogawensis]|nr:hypothetical protein [Flammeovirga kamogawensis]
MSSVHLQKDNNYQKCFDVAVKNALQFEKEEFKKNYNSLKKRMKKI